MAQGLFTTGFTVDDVLAIQARAKAMVMEGKTIMSWSDSETNATKQFAMPPAQVLDECRYALRVLDPGTYGRQRFCSSSSVGAVMEK